MAAKTEQDKMSGRDWLVDRLLRALIWGAMRLPYATRIRAFGWLVQRIVGPVAGYRARARDQLAKIYPQMSRSEQHLLANQVLNNFGRTIIETYSSSELASHIAKTPITGAGMAAIQAARASGRPVLFVTGHFGNHEVARHALTNQGYVIGGMYRPMANRYFNAHYKETLLGQSGPVFAQGRKGTIGFARMLKSGGMGTLLFDVRFAGGAKIDFLGLPAPTALSAAELALKFDALLVPYFATRRADGINFDIEVEKPIPATDPLTMMQDATARLEARVLKNPGQWFWVHRRWSR